MTNQEEIREIELSITEAQKKVKLSKDLEKLEKNTEFKNIITNLYFKDEIIRLVLLKAHPAIADNEERINKINRDLAGIAALNQYFEFIKAQGIAAQNAIDSSNSYLDSIQDN